MTPYRDELPEVLKAFADIFLTAILGLGLLSSVYVVTVIFFSLERLAK